MPLYVNKNTFEEKNLNPHEVTSEWVYRKKVKSKTETEELFIIPDIPKKYMKWNGDYTAIEEMDQTEKDAIDGVELIGSKLTKNMQIESNTNELNKKGIPVPGNESILVKPNIPQWNALLQKKNDLTYPFAVDTIDYDEYLVQDSAELDAIYSVGMGQILANENAGRALHLQVKAATTQAELDAIVDDRS